MQEKANRQFVDIEAAEFWSFRTFRSSAATEDTLIWIFWNENCAKKLYITHSCWVCHVIGMWFCKMAEWWLHFILEKNMQSKTSSNSVTLLLYKPNSNWMGRFEPNTPVHLTCMKPEHPEKTHADIERSEVFIQINLKTVFHILSTPIYVNWDGQNIRNDLHYNWILWTSSFKNEYVLPHILANSINLGSEIDLPSQIRTHIYQAK